MTSKQTTTATLNPQQRMRTARKLTVPVGETSVDIPARTRVIVIGKPNESGQYNVKVADPKVGSDLNGVKFAIGPSRLVETHRGRPKGSTKSAPEAQDAPTS